MKARYKIAIALGSLLVGIVAVTMFLRPRNDALDILLLQSDEFEMGLLGDIHKPPDDPTKKPIVKSVKVTGEDARHIAEYFVTARRKPEILTTCLTTYGVVIKSREVDIYLCTSCGHFFFDRPNGYGGGHDPMGIDEFKAFLVKLLPEIDGPGN